MKIFLDSINVKEIKHYQDIGIIDGVTTNPSLMAKSNREFAEIVKELCDLVQGDVSVEVAAEDYEGMCRDGDKILQIASNDNVVIKLPTTWEGLRACKYFSQRGHKTNMTLCFSASQALLAAKCGATYVSPFIGRLNDAGGDGYQLIQDISIIYENHQFETQILAASIRSVDHVVELAVLGADVVTLTGNILTKLAEHQLTTIGLEKFTSDWKKSGMKI